MFFPPWTQWRGKLSFTLQLTCNISSSWSFGWDLLSTMNHCHRRPLLSQEDNNDVVSNYFSKKQKGVGLLSVFNKVHSCMSPASPFPFVPFQIKEFGDLIWNNAVFGVRLWAIVQCTYIIGYVWFTIASLWIWGFTYYAKWRGGKLKFDFVHTFSF